MFTGIIQAQGSIKEIRSSNEGAVFVLNSNSLDLSVVSIGDSIAVNGVCLTVTQLDENCFSADVSQENLELHNFFSIKERSKCQLREVITT